MRARSGAWPSAPARDGLVALRLGRESLMTLTIDGCRPDLTVDARPALPLLIRA